jgi:hypothetical protein
LNVMDMPMSAQQVPGNRPRLVCTWHTNSGLFF